MQQQSVYTSQYLTIQSTDCRTSQALIFVLQNSHYLRTRILTKNISGFFFVLEPWHFIAMQGNLYFYIFIIHLAGDVQIRFSSNLFSGGLLSIILFFLEKINIKQVTASSRMFCVNSV